MREYAPFKADDVWRTYDTPAQIQAFCEALLDRWNLTLEDEKSEPPHGTPTVRPPRGTR